MSWGEGKRSTRAPPLLQVACSLGHYAGGAARSLEDKCYVLSRVLPASTSSPRRTSEKREGWPGGLLEKVTLKVDVQSAPGQS